MLFAAHSKLAVLGGNQGRIFGDGAVQYRGKVASTEPLWIPYINPEVKIPFAFVHGVNVGPIFFRHDVYLDLSGVDYDYSRPGESGIHFDYEICFRAWQQGYRVRCCLAPFNRRVGTLETFVTDWRNRRRTI